MLKASSVKHKKEEGHVEEEIKEDEEM